MNNKILTIIAKNVKNRRLELNLSQERLAELAELHPNYISLIERSKCNISVITLEKLAKALEVEISEIFK